MSQQTTIRKLAELVNTPVEKLLEQLAEAGMKFSGPDQVVTSIEKVKLLGFLKRSHGKAETAEAAEAPKKITLNRSRKEELTVGGGKNKSTVDVVVRKKVTLVKPTEKTGEPVTDERAEILRKLEESRARNTAEQQRLADADRKRAEEAERIRLEAAEAARLKAEEEARAAAEAALAAGEDEPVVRKPTGHGHPKHPHPAPVAPRVDDRNAPKHKARGSHVMVAGVEDDDAASRFAGQLHLSAQERARRTTGARGKPKPRRQAEQARSGGGAHGFSKPTAPIVREVAIGDTITVADLAQKLALKGGDVVKALFKMGVMATITQSIDHDTAALVTEELGHTVVKASENTAEDALLAHVEETQGEKVTRPPVVTIMGHVDHGKTSLLDAIRHANVVSGEAGGITQHIGAYQVEQNGNKITFIDTPGHAAFTAMRARGAQATDIAVLVVAADDSVMPQTIESINHAKAAGVPIIVAINKIDKHEANPDKVRQQLLQHEVFVESMGGEVLDVEVSAKTHKNLDKLLEAILLQAEILDLRADPDRTAEGTVVEAQLDRGRGSVATVLVQKGTLTPGQIIVAGDQWGRVRALVNDKGEHVKEAPPSMPVEILGLSGTPQAGDKFAVVENESRAREISEYRQRLARDKAVARASGQRGSLEQMMMTMQNTGLKEFPLVIKGDVQGSIEAIAGALEKLGNDEVRARIVHSGAGAITESDISLAEASNAAIIGFNVRANAQARTAAERAGIEIRYYNIIYDLTDDVKAAMSGLLSPERRETFLGNAEILEVFNITKVGKVAGCRVVEGKVERGAGVRLVRDNVVIHEGKLKTLKRFKDEVSEVPMGQECGMAFENYEDIRAGDTIECFRVEHITRTL